jgi:nucleoid-associated protein YgaU
MPGDVKFGLLLAAGVVLFCGAKRISVQKEADEAVAAISREFNGGKASLDKGKLPTELARKSGEVGDKIASGADDLSIKAKKAVDSGTKKSNEALANLSPKELREKVQKTEDQADEAIADLDLPSDLGGDAPAPKKDAAQSISSPSKREISNNAGGVSKLPKPSSTSDDLPPVKTTDVSRVRENLPKGTSSPPKGKSSTDEEFGSLDLPSDLSGSAPSRLSNSPAGSAPSRLSDSPKSSPAGSKSSPRNDDFPKPLPDADRVGTPTGLHRVSTQGPIHPYFARFLKEGSYFVRDGDSLREIAFNLYQDESKAADIIAANKETLRSASDLKPGMKLRLP